MASLAPRPTHHLWIYLGARLAGTVGIQVQSLAIGWQVYARTGDPLHLGLVGLAQFAPLALLSLWAGSVADRVDRRRMLIVCRLLYGGGSAALGVLAMLRSDVTAIYAVLVLLGAIRAFAAPAGVALLPSLVSQERLPRAIALSSSTFHVATIAGPAVGGLLYALGGAQTAYFTAAGLEVVACALLLLLGHRPIDRQAPEEGALERLLGGVRYVWNRKILLGAVSLDLFAVLLGGAVALMPVYARDILHVGETGLGFLRSAPAVGALAVALLLSWRPLVRHTGLWMLGCVALFGAATIVFGLSSHFALSVIALAVLGAADMVSVVVRQSLVQIQTPDAMRGRVAAVSMIFVGASNELGELESGLTAAWLGTVRAVVVGGIGTIAVTGLWALLFPALRRVDRLSSEKQD